MEHTVEERPGSERGARRGRKTGRLSGEEIRKGSPGRGEEIGRGAYQREDREAIRERRPGGKPASEAASGRVEWVIVGMSPGGKREMPGLGSRVREKKTKEYIG